MLSKSSVVKVYKKVKIIDWIAIVFISGLIIYLILNSIKKNEWVTITFKVQVTPANITYNGETPPFWIADQIKTGDIQLDNYGRPNLKILRVNSWGTAAQDTWVQASIKTNVKIKNKIKSYTFMYQPLEIGRPIEAVINGAYIRGVVTAIEGISDTRKTSYITIEARIIDEYSPYSVASQGVNPWIADAIQKGQKMTDAEGNILAEIIETQNIPADRIITTSDGRFVVAQDPIKRNVIFKVKLKVMKYRNTYLFLEDKPIKIGFGFPLYFNNIFLNPVITKILTEN